MNSLCPSGSDQRALADPRHLLHLTVTPTGFQEIKSQMNLFIGKLARPAVPEIRVLPQDLFRRLGAFHNHSAFVFRKSEHHSQYEIKDYIAACDRCQKQDAPETQVLWQTSWRHMVDALNTTPFLIPFRYDDDQPGTEDKALHLTPSSADRINKDAIVVHCGQLTGFQMMPLLCNCGEDGRPNLITDWWDLSRFNHSDGYSFAINDSSHGMMRYFTRGGGGNEFLGVYTDIDYVLKSFGNAPCPHIAIFSISDVLRSIRLQANLAGVLINPDTETHCFISRKQLGIS